MQFQAIQTKRKTKMKISFGVLPATKRGMSTLPRISRKMELKIETSLRKLMNTKGRPKFNPSIRIMQVSDFAGQPVCGTYLKAFLVKRQIVEIEGKRKEALLIAASFRAENEIPPERKTEAAKFVRYTPFSDGDPFREYKVRAGQGAGMLHLLHKLREQFPSLQIEDVSDYFFRARDGLTEAAALAVLADHICFLDGAQFDCIFVVTN